MARLYRPTVPLAIKNQVAERQLREREERSRMRFPRPSSSRALSHQIEFRLQVLAELMMCEVSDLRLDHDPPLGARPQERRGLGKKTYYVPDANDPDHLFYRPHGPQHEGSHLIKTNVRGDHGQHPDRVLIKKARRIERGPRPKRRHGLAKNPRAPKPKWPSRPFPKRSKRK